MKERKEEKYLSLFLLGNNDHVLFERVSSGEGGWGGGGGRRGGQEQTNKQTNKQTNLHQQTSHNCNTIATRWS